MTRKTAQEPANFASTPPELMISISHSYAGVSLQGR
jgi:hypothetical protein